jgi:hypothetical protein
MATNPVLPRFGSAQNQNEANGLLQDMYRTMNTSYAAAYLSGSYLANNVFS